ncbi:MAG TPA: hypothetical protein VHS99_13260 [Chloroflexota bacterium]|jgi:hypothetical protein|nr:hypothetical protein [Chloroflexota bacterium]
MTSTISSSSASTPLRCSRHRDVATTIRCANCNRPFCRDCVVNRFVTSRSTVWLCRPCAGMRGGAFDGGGLIRHRASSRSATNWWVVAGIAALVLYAAYQSRLFLF